MPYKSNIRLEPIFITLAPSSFRNIGIVWVYTMPTGRFVCTHVVIFLIKQSFCTMPMRFSYISRFITGCRKHICETNQTIGNTILIIHVTVTRHPILLRKCTRHQHGTMRTTQRASTARPIKNNTLFGQPVQVRSMNRITYRTQNIAICRIAP